MRRFLFLFIYVLCFSPVEATTIVRNEMMKAQGLTVESVKNWITKTPKHQTQNGEYYFDALGETYYHEPKIGRVSLNDGVKLIDFVYSDKKFFLIQTKNGENKFISQFVIKELGDPELEIARLEALQKAEGKFRIAPYIADLYDSYKIEGKNTYFLLLDAAKGVSFLSYIKKAYENFDTDIFVKEKFPRLEKAFQALGRTLSLFHQENMQWETAYEESKSNEDAFTFFKTITHGDLHFDNIFYDDFEDEQAYGDVTFIDNETMAKAIEIGGDSILQDFSKIYHKNLIKRKFFFKKTKSVELMIAFFKAYIEAFPPKYEKQITDYVIKILKDYRLRGSGRKTFKTLDITHDDTTYFDSIADKIIADLR